MNAYIDKSDRRIPIDRMIYVADGPSDIPCFSVVKNNGGKTYAVFQPENDAEFAQNDALLHAGRIHSYGPADYTANSTTTNGSLCTFEKSVIRLFKNGKRSF